MKTIYTALLTIAFFTINPVMNAQNFYLHANGVTCMCPNAAVGDTGVVNGITYTKRTKEQITPQNAITTCTSGITDMSYLFNNGFFNENINSWDVSSVTNMTGMFSGTTDPSYFNQPLNNWDVSNVTNMTAMFFYARFFNRDISSWDVSNVTNMSSMFGQTNYFNQPLNNWDVSNVTNMRGMFSTAYEFNQPLNNWDVSNVTDMSYMFSHARFNQPLNDWNVSNVTDMSYMFRSASWFNQSIDNWDVSNVTDMHRLFLGASSFNQPLNNWDVSNVSNMWDMFRDASSFNQPLNNWDVSSVTNMNSMFSDASSFNQDISSWCVVQFPTEPTNFSTNCPLQQSFKPQWGVSSEDCFLSSATVSNPQNDIKLYPNPTHDVFILDNQSDQSIETITILNMEGQVVKQINGNQTNTQQINIFDLASGNYFVQIEANKTILFKRLIKK